MSHQRQPKVFKGDPREKTVFREMNRAKQQVLNDFIDQITNEDFQAASIQKREKLAKFKAHALAELQKIAAPTGFFTKLMSHSFKDWDSDSQAYYKLVKKSIDALPDLKSTSSSLEPDLKSTSSSLEPDPKSIELQRLQEGDPKGGVSQPIQKPNFSLMPLITDLLPPLRRSRDVHPLYQNLVQTVDRLRAEASTLVQEFRPSPDDPRIREKTTEIDNFLDGLIQEKLKGLPKVEYRIPDDLQDLMKSTDTAALDRAIRQNEQQIDSAYQEPMGACLYLTLLLLRKAELTPAPRQELAARLTLSGPSYVDQFNRAAAQSLRVQHGPQAQQQTKAGDRKEGHRVP